LTEKIRKIDSKVKVNVKVNMDLYSA